MRHPADQGTITVKLRPAERLDQARKRIDRAIAIESGLAPPPWMKTKRRRSLTQDLLKEIAAKLWPDGYEYVETKVLIKDVGDQLEKQGKPVPGRDVFLRALGRRKG